MCECYPCQSCWINAGKCNGLALLVGCCGAWCFKGPLMEMHDPTCCYCFQLSGIGCNLCCLGFVCCHPAWLDTYAQNQFETHPNYHAHQPNPQQPFPLPSPQQIQQQQHSHHPHEEHHHHHAASPHHLFGQNPDVNASPIYVENPYSAPLDTPTPFQRDANL